jgi:23S rRNA pseudouridine2605 synthase
MTAPKQERIAKVIARSGLCSRRDAERLIAEGRVQLEGRVLDSPAVVVAPGARIRVDGKALPRAEATRLFCYHKPRGRVTSTKDPDGRPTIYDDLPAGLPRLQPVGRLDIASEGLLLLTNDGELKRFLELPANALARGYRVRVFGQVSEERLARLAEGTTIEGVRYGPIEAMLERGSGSNAWLLMSLREGKNREIRKVCEHLGLRVNRLQRLSYGPFELGALAPGAIWEVPAELLAKRLDHKTARRSRSGFAKAKARSPKPKLARAKKSGGHAHRRRTP